MTYVYNQPNLTSGVDDALLDVGIEVSAFPIGLLLFTFFVVLFGGAASQMKRMGYSDFPMWTLLASLSCLLISMMMTLKAGLIGIDILGIVVAVNIMAALWFFTSKGKGEV